MLNSKQISRIVQINRPVHGFENTIDQLQAERGSKRGPHGQCTAQWGRAYVQEISALYFSHLEGLLHAIACQCRLPTSLTTVPSPRPNAV